MNEYPKNNQIVIGRRSNRTKLISLTIILTNLTQMPQLISSGYNSIITMVSWSILLIVALLHTRKLSKDIFYSLFLLIIVLIYSFLLQLITHRNYMDISELYPFALSVFVFCTGILCASIIPDGRSFATLHRCYLLSGIVVAASVYLQIRSGYFNWLSRSYAYASKNSVSQILLTAVILCVFLNDRYKIARWIIGGMIIYLLMMLRSRASLIGLVILSFYIFRDRDIKRGYKVLLAIGIIVAIVILLLNRNMYNIIVNGVILGGRNKNNLEDLSSGRYSMLLLFLHIFPDYALTGYGSYYLESFPLSILFQYGIVGTIPFFFFLLLPFRRLKSIKYPEAKQIILVLTMCYYANGLFEELSPLGPGVKCYYLWFLLGCTSKRQLVE